MACAKCSGADAWNRLPEAVRERFADTAGAATYAGAFEVVRASWLGRVFAWLGTLFGTPVAPRAGTQCRSARAGAARRGRRRLGSRIPLGRRRTPPRAIHEGGDATTASSSKNCRRACACRSIPSKKAASCTS